MIIGVGVIRLFILIKAVVRGVEAVTPRFFLDTNYTNLHERGFAYLVEIRGN